jgi:pyrimidine-nucleoside phosphorylase
VRWIVSDMDSPRGRFVGNALEVAGAGEVLRGEGPEDVRELAVRLAGDLAESAGVSAPGEGRGEAAAALADGRALASAERWVEAQGGDPAVWTDPAALPTAPVRIDVPAPRDGWVATIPARGIGEVARWLGAGRLHSDQSIDPVAGVEIVAGVGSRVAEGDPIVVVHGRDEWAGERAREMAEAWIAVSEDEVARPPLVVGEGGGDAGAA